jgi:hypothetical protein
MPSYEILELARALTVQSSCYWEELLCSCARDISRITSTYRSLMLVRGMLAMNLLTPLIFFRVKVL